MGVPLRFSTSKSTLSKLIKPSVRPDIRPAKRVRKMEPAPSGRWPGSSLTLLQRWCLCSCIYGNRAEQSKGRVLTECVGEYSRSGRRVFGHALRHGSTDKLLPSHRPHALDRQDAFRSGAVSLLNVQSRACTCMHAIDQYVGIDRWRSIWVWKLDSIHGLGKCGASCGRSQQIGLPGITRAHSMMCRCTMGVLSSALLEGASKLQEARLARAQRGHKDCPAINSMSHAAAVLNNATVHLVTCSPSPSCMPNLPVTRLWAATAVSRAAERSASPHQMSLSLSHSTPSRSSASSNSVKSTLYRRTPPMPPNPRQNWLPSCDLFVTNSS